MRIVGIVYKDEKKAGETVKPAEVKTPPKPAEVKPTENKGAKK